MEIGTYGIEYCTDVALKGLNFVQHCLWVIYVDF